MAMNKKMTRQAMKYWTVGGLRIRARTMRVAMRKYERGNAGHRLLCSELELDNPFGCGEMPCEIDPKYARRVLRRWDVKAPHSDLSTRAKS